MDDQPESHRFFKETRLSLEPSSPSSVVNIGVPSPTGRASQPRPTDSSAAQQQQQQQQDETTFRRRHLATASAVFYRSSSYGRASGGAPYAPRAFLWRVLEDGAVLTIRAIDVHRDRAAPDAPLVLNFHFATAIQPGCVALADSAEHDALHVFVLDQTPSQPHLFCLTLRPDFFRRRSVLEGAVADALKVHAPAEIAGRHPHRLYAASPDLLVVALRDGTLVRLERTKPGDGVGKPWRDQTLNSAGWGVSLRNLVTFKGKNTIQYGKIAMGYGTVTSAQATDLDVAGGARFLFTVCLDHRMRVWNLATGQLVHAGDILGKERTPQELGRWAIDPSHTTLVQVVSSDHHAAGSGVCVTYSPVGAAEFKFWTVTVGDGGGTVTVEDRFPALRLAPVSPSSSDVWTLADFAVMAADAHPAGKMQLWALWKNNLTYRVQRIEFRLGAVDERLWATGWAAVVPVDTGAGAPQPDRACGPWESTDVTEKSLQTILAPGRFTSPTLETALSMYERSSLGGGAARADQPSSRTSKKSLAESICAVLGSTATLERRGGSGPSGGAGMDYDEFRRTAEKQWRQFHRLLMELDKQRGEALSLALDRDEGMAWVICADAVSAIRTCSRAEQVIVCGAVGGGSGGGGEAAAKLVSVGFGFVDGLSDSALQLCRTALRPELLGETSKTDLERIQIFLDRSGLWRSLGDDECAQVTDALGQNFVLATPAAYRQVLELVTRRRSGSGREGDGSSGGDGVGDDGGAAGPRSRAIASIAYADHAAAAAMTRPVTEFGRKLVVRATQEMAELQWQLCLSQLVLLAHMEFESETEEEALHNSVDIGSVFRQLVGALRRLELVRWLARTEISAPAAGAPGGDRWGIGSPTSARRGGDDLAAPQQQHAQQQQQTITVLEGNVSHLIGFPDFGGAGSDGLAAAITDVVGDLCAPDGDIEIGPTLVQSFLIRRERADLAQEVGPLCDQEPTSVYVQGRVALALRDLDTASALFRRAAVGMSRRNDGAEWHSAGLLDETEKRLLHNGMTKYYLHIVALFEKTREHGHVLDFGRLALQFHRAEELGQQAQQTQTMEQREKIRTEILGCMFAAATETSRFEMAHASLQAMAAGPLQESCLRCLVERMCETGHGAEMVALPFGRLQPAVDGLLERRCRAGPGPGPGSADRGGGGGVSHQILYAWRIRHSDFRGAAAALLDRIRKLRRAGEGDRLLAEGEGGDGFDTAVTRQYLLLINALSCVDEGEAWIFDEAGGEAGGEAKRRVITLADVRREYQDELDRISAIQNNQFGFEGEEIEMELG